MSCIDILLIITDLDSYSFFQEILFLVNSCGH